MFKNYQNLITIGIVTFNEAKYIRETLESCISQAGKILILDCGSRDDTLAICQEFAGKYPNIELISYPQDPGKDFAFNEVLKRCQSKYFMWCGPHDLLSENYTANMVHMLENSDAVGCYSPCKSITITGES